MAKRYVHGSGEDDPLFQYIGPTLNNRYSLQADHQGSIISLADSTGALGAINTYDEYGVPGATNFGRFQYTGQIYLSELGMYYYKARIYSSRLGRFLQTDPIGYKDQMDLYAYVANDPIDGSDPDGQYTVGGSNLVSTGPIPGMGGFGWGAAHQSKPRLIKPVQGSITTAQAQSAEDKVGFREKGESESGAIATTPGYQAIAAFNARNGAFADEADYMHDGGHGHNNYGDAFRHADATIRLTRSANAAVAKRLGDAHERSEVGQPRGERLMDLINNNNARILSGIHPDMSPADLASYALEHGLLQTSPVTIRH